VRRCEVTGFRRPGPGRIIGAMGRRVFEVSATVPVGPSAVVDFLMDLTRHRGLHPFLVSASVAATGTSSEGPWWEWRVEERPRLGPVRYRLRFPARLTRTSSASMTAVVRAGPGCSLCSTTTARADGDGCRVVETAEVTAPWPVLGYMARQGEAAHVRTFARLPEVLG
jgi:DNA-binding transcriptional LysR family regulator